MSTVTIDAEAVEKLRSALPMSRTVLQGEEIEGGPLAALQPEVKMLQDFEAVGWPSWLAEAYGTLYSKDVGVYDDEQEDADLWAYRIAVMLAQPLDYGRVQVRLLQCLLGGVEFLDKSDLSKRLLSLYDNMLEGHVAVRELQMLAASAEEGFRALCGADWEDAPGLQQDVFLAIRSGARLDIPDVMNRLVDLDANRAMEAEFPRFGMTGDLMDGLRQPNP